MRGDSQWAAAYEGCVYQFAGSDQLERFLANPSRFTPAGSGLDLVQAIDGKQRVAGRTNYCVTYQGRLYMFSSAASLDRFHQNPERYAIGN